MVVTDPGIEVYQQEQVFRVDDAGDDGAEFFIEQVFDFRRGAECWRKFTEPDAVDKRRDRMRSESFVGGSIVLSREFLTAHPTPWKRSSSGCFLCQKKV